MYRRKKIKRKANKKQYFQKAAPPQPEVQLSHIWYNNDEIQTVLGMSPSTIKRRRADGSLIASKKKGKIFFNDYHVQEWLRGGLPKTMFWLGTMFSFTDGWETLLIA